MDALIKTHPQDAPVYQFLDKKCAQIFNLYKIFNDLQLSLDFLFAGFFITSAIILLSFL